MVWSWKQSLLSDFVFTLVWSMWNWVSVWCFSEMHWSISVRAWNILWQIAEFSRRGSEGSSRNSGWMGLMYLHGAWQLVCTWSRPVYFLRLQMILVSNARVKSRTKWVFLASAWLIIVKNIVAWADGVVVCIELISYFLKFFWIQYLFWELSLSTVSSVGWHVRIAWAWPVIDLFVFPYARSKSRKMVKRY